MNNLAHAYSALGRLREALELFQTTLVFRRLSLTENHPQIGTLPFSVFHSLNAVT
jgi:hypothetical protein